MWPGMEAGQKSQNNDNADNGAASEIVSLSSDVIKIPGHHFYITPKLMESSIKAAKGGVMRRDDALNSKPWDRTKKRSPWNRVPRRITQVGSYETHSKKSSQHRHYQQ